MTFGWVFLIAFLAGGIVVAFVGARYRKFSRFPKAEAALLRKQVVPTMLQGGQSGYRLEVLFAYEVAGTRHESDTLYSMGSMGVAHAFATGAENKLERKYDFLKEGENVTIQYDPESPGEAFILNGPAMMLWLPLLVTLGFGLLALLYLWPLLTR